MSIVKIIPPPSGDGDDPKRLGWGTRVLDGSGKPIPNVISIDVHYCVDEPITATIRVHADPQPVSALASIIEVCPHCGAEKKRAEGEEEA